MNRERIVVGVDHTPASHSALSWAAAEASRRQAELIVVHARDTTFAQPAPYAPSLRRTEAERAHLSRQAVTHDVISVIEAKYPDIRVHRHLSRRNAAEALLRQSDGADLLVLGSSATRTSEGYLGPVLLSCLRYAQCPVVVVNHDDSRLPGEPLASAHGERHT